MFWLAYPMESLRVSTEHGPQFVTNQDIGDDMSGPIDQTAFVEKKSQYQLRNKVIHKGHKWNQDVHPESRPGL
jgi:hypothetical protein